MIYKVSRTSENLRIKHSKVLIRLIRLIRPIRVQKNLFNLISKLSPVRQSFRSQFPALQTRLRKGTAEQRDKPCKHWATVRVLVGSPLIDFLDVRLTRHVYQGGLARRSITAYGRLWRN
jgi:hypothetical protein